MKGGADNMLIRSTCRCAARTRRQVISNVSNAVIHERPQGVEAGPCTNDSLGNS